MSARPVEESAPPADRDLTSIAEARALARRAREAWRQLAEFNQEQIDAIVDAMAAAAPASVAAFTAPTSPRTMTVT